MSIKNIEVYEYKRFVIFLIDPVIASKTAQMRCLLRRQKRSLPQAAVLAARFATRFTKQGNQQRRAQADKQWADV